MKRLLTIATIIAIALTVNAQNAAQQKRIAAVRSLYADALKRIEQDASIPETHNATTVDISRMVAATGLQKKKVTFYYYEAGTEEDIYKWDLYFIRENYNVASRKVACEYLVDPESGKPVFYFCKKDVFDSSEPTETRIYFNENGTPCFMQNTYVDDSGKTRKEAVKNLSTNKEIKVVLAAFKRYQGIHTSLMHVD